MLVRAMTICWRPDGFHLSLKVLNQGFYSNLLHKKRITKRELSTWDQSLYLVLTQLWNDDTEDLPNLQVKSQTFRMQIADQANQKEFDLVRIRTRTPALKNKVFLSHRFHK